MSDKIVVATLPKNTNAAYEAARAIKNLKQAGITDFKLKTGVMLNKDDLGNVSLLRGQGPPPARNGRRNGGLEH